MVKNLRFGLLMLLMAVTTSVFAQATPENPEDQTNLIANSDFAKGSEGWTITRENVPNAQPLGNAWEFWGGDAATMKFDINQVLTLPAGTYELSAELSNSWNGLAANENEGRAHLYALTAGGAEFSVPVEPQTENCGDRRDTYKVYFQVAEGDATTTIGWKTVGTQAARWFSCDNFKLSYFGTCTIAEAQFAGYIKQLKTAKAEAEAYVANANVADAVKTKLTEAIVVADAELANAEQTEATLQAAIDVIVAANNAAKLSVTNREAIDAHYALIESTNVYTTEAYETFKAAVDAYQTSWEAGTLAETVVNPSAVQGWRSANAYDDYLLSAWTIGGVQAKDFDAALYINTWSVEGNNDGSNFIVPFFEYWTGDGETLGANTIQAVKAGLEPGKKYTVSAWVRVRQSNGKTDAPAGITLKAGAEGTPVNVCAGEQVGSSQFYLDEFVANGVADDEGNLTITFEVAANNISWLSFKNVKVGDFYESSNLDFAEGTPAVVGICTYLKDIASNGTELAEMQEVPGWTIVENGDAHAGGVFAYGSEVWLGGKGYNVPATNSKGEATGNALGIVAVWGATSQYTQKVTLEAGSYEINVPVYNAVGGTQTPGKGLIGFVAEDGTEYLAPANAYAVDTWTTETIRFTLTEQTNGVISLGYKSPGSGSGANPHWFIDYVEVKPISEAEVVRPALLDAIAAANATIEAKANVGVGLFLIPESAIDMYSYAVAEAQMVADNAEASVDEIKGAIESLAFATSSYYASAPANGANMIVTQNASGLNLAIVDGGIKLAENGSALQFVAASTGGWYITDGTSYVSYKGTDKWTLTATTVESATAWTIAANAEGLYTISGKNGSIGTDNTTAGSPCYGDKSGERTLWTIVEDLENVTANPESGSTVKTDLTAIDVTFVDATVVVANPENYDAIAILDAEGNYAGAIRFAQFTMVENTATIKNMMMGNEMPFFEAPGTYTIEVPAGKFLVGADSASVAPSKAFKLNYVVEAAVIEVEMVADPANGSTVASIANIHFSFPGYEVAEPNWNNSENIVVKKDGEVYKEFTGIKDGEYNIDYSWAWNEFEFVFDLTEAGEYTIEIPAGKIWDAMNMVEFPAFTLNYTLTGAVVEDVENVEVIPENGSTLTTLDDVISFMFNDAAYAEVNAECTDPVTIVDAAGNSMSLKGAKFATLNGLANAFDLTNELVAGNKLPLFPAVGEYTVVIPAGKFLIGADAETLAPSKVIKFNYTVIEPVEKAIVADPASGSTVETLETVTLTFQGYDYMNVDYNVWGNEGTIVIKKDGEVYKEGTFTGFGEVVYVNDNTSRIKFGLTEPGEYTIEVPAGKFCSWEEDAPAFTLTYTVTGAVVETKTEVVYEVERIAGLGYDAVVVDVDMAAICEKLGIASIDEATVWGVNATTMEYVANAMATYDGWRNVDGDFVTWGADASVCYKYDASTFTLCTYPGQEPAVGTAYNAYWAFTTATDTVVVKTVINIVEAPKVEVETVKTITINTTAEALTAYANTPATFNVAEVCEALGVTDLTAVETFIVNATTGEFVMNTTDGWRDANGDAAAWGSGEGMVCVKLSDPTSGSFDYIAAIDETIQIGTVYTAKWAIVANGKAVVLDVVIEFVTPVGINGVEADVVKTEYFGVNGAALNAPAKGVNIVKQTLANGKVVTSKVYVK